MNSLLNYQNSKLNLYSIIAEDIKDRIIRIISKYNSTNTQDIRTTYINDYIKYSIIEKNSDLNKLLMNFLTINDNKSSQEFIANIHSYESVFNELIDLKINNTNLFNMVYRNKLSIAKENLERFF